MYRTLSAPVVVQWEVTPSCNLDCLHCYNHWRRGEPVQQKLEDITQIYQAVVSEVIANQIFSVVVTGGEPLLVLDQIVPFLRQFRDANVQVFLNSNLTLLNDEIAVKLRELGIKSILTSLPSGVLQTNDKITQRKGAHAKTTKGIKIALANGIKVTVNMVVTKINLSNIYTTAQYIADLGVKSFAATKAATPGNCPDFSPYALSRDEFRYMIRELVRVKDKLGLRIDSLEFYPYCAFEDENTRSTFGSRICSAGKTNCAIGYDGQIRPCSRSEATYGDIRDGFASAWEKMADWRTNVWLPAQCTSCSLKNKCVGGCKVDAFRTTGSISNPDPMCDFSQLPIRSAEKRLRPTRSRRFTVNPILKYRPEEFGGILFVTIGHWVPTEKNLYELICSKDKEVVSIEEIASTLSVEDRNVSETVAYLVSKSILQEEKE